MKPKTFSDDPPAFVSAVAQTAHYFSVIMGGLSGLAAGISYRPVKDTPNYSISDRRSTVRPSQSRPTCRQQTPIDSHSCPSYSSVCGDGVSSQMEKPPDYWTWMEHQRTVTKDVFTFPTPPPLYNDVANHPSDNVPPGATGTNNPAVVVDSNSVKETDRDPHF